MQIIACRIVAMAISSRGSRAGKLFSPDDELIPLFPDDQRRRQPQAKDKPEITAKHHKNARKSVDIALFKTLDGR